jgi:dihydropteroate synthase
MTEIMGILNMTPDSFSDGGMHKDDALQYAYGMIDAGADIIDIGGESTRPGAVPVPADAEIRRIIQIVKDLSSTSDVTISVDTMKTEVAAKALDAGADIINDVNGLRSEGMAELIASAGVPVVIMHMNGMPSTMQDNPMGIDRNQEIISFLKERVDYALNCGIKDIILDPGIGFGKTPELNMHIIDNVSEYSLGYPVLIGASRKRFLREYYKDTDADEATVNVSLRAVKSGADIVRVHNVALMSKALRNEA